MLRGLLWFCWLLWWRPKRVRLSGFAWGPLLLSGGGMFTSLLRREQQRRQPLEVVPLEDGGVGPQPGDVVAGVFDLQLVAEVRHKVRPVRVMSPQGGEASADAAPIVLGHGVSPSSLKLLIPQLDTTAAEGSGLRQSPLPQGAMPQRQWITAVASRRGGRLPFGRT